MTLPQSTPTEGLLATPRTSEKAVIAAVEDYKAYALANQHHMQFTTLHPLTFWKTYNSHFPLLQHVARALFGVPPSSACVERSFSSTGLLMDGRERLTAQHLQQLAVIRDTLRQWKKHPAAKFCQMVESLVDSVAPP